MTNATRVNPIEKQLAVQCLTLKTLRKDYTRAIACIFEMQ